jgi:steroid delta-isomerase-like uncharacterized protein
MKTTEAMKPAESSPATPSEPRGDHVDRTKRWLMAAVAGLLAIVAGLSVWLVVQSSDSASAEIVDQWAEAFLDSDADAVAGLFTDDGVYEERDPTRAFTGQAAIRSQLEEAFLFADATSMDVETIVVGEGMLGGHDVVIVEWTMSGMSAAGRRSPTDKTPFSVGAITIFEMEDGLISRSVFYAPWSDLFN